MAQLAARTAQAALRACDRLLHTFPFVFELLSCSFEMTLTAFAAPFKLSVAA
jgi:hypothetical protein